MLLLLILRDSFQMSLPATAAAASLLTNNPSYESRYLNVTSGPAVFEDVVDEGEEGEKQNSFKMVSQPFSRGKKVEPLEIEDEETPPTPVRKRPKSITIMPTSTVIIVSPTDEDEEDDDAEVSDTQHDRGRGRLSIAGLPETNGDLAGDPIWSDPKKRSQIFKRRSAVHGLSPNTGLSIGAVM